jgi:hypothetical protein
MVRQFPHLGMANSIAGGNLYPASRPLAIANPFYAAKGGAPGIGGTDGGNTSYCGPNCAR